MAGAMPSSQTRERRPAATVRLMIVDDSMVARAVLSRMVASDPMFEIAAVAGTAEDAIVALGHTDVDIILLDLEMPGAGGLKLLPDILAAARGAQVLIVSSQAESGARETVEALAMGAADTLPKPGTGRFNGSFSQILVERLRNLARNMIADRQPGRPAPTIAPIPCSHELPLREMPDAPLELLAIGASTGGIHALANLFAALPRTTGVPILVTQHLPPAFMAVFARQLAAASGRPCHVAIDNMPLRAEQIYVAPGDAHLCCELRRSGLAARLSQKSVPSGCRPSVDPMFESAAECFGPGALGIVLTGMGRDGSTGAAMLVGAGGAVMAQDEQSSAVWGMPRSIADAGLAAAIDDPVGLARRVADRLEGN
ncbi:chemotaxis-specific protein-glutamate methyltransferase CheB [Sphingomicrobium lutaoense]|uniref:protein-glutamate methylesterase n=1 Tax=Sphingomicrobium lutaoense TaxID=515949 RepID=A0A839Z0S2_9SPHN|nr:chemotaxis-specific protein-glutamate methyltransferase CheB [Sphingomicrobium lutaoense]MBB3763647.1 two-component system chemotaxis response regulator CheB [Sphingomicrobium lutaoense]